MQIQKLSRFSQACGSCVNEVNYVGFNQPWETLVWLFVCPRRPLEGREVGLEEDKRLTKEWWLCFYHLRCFYLEALVIDLRWQQSGNAPDTWYSYQVFCFPTTTKKDSAATRQPNVYRCTMIRILVVRFSSSARCTDWYELLFLVVFQCGSTGCWHPPDHPGVLRFLTCRPVNR